MPWRSLRPLLLAAVCGSAVWLAGGPQQAWGGGDCARTSVGFLPLIDLGQGAYRGFQGGLDPEGSNARPADQDEAADTFARVTLLDRNGLPDAVLGSIVLLTVGMSNTNRESIGPQFRCPTGHLGV